MTQSPENLNLTNTTVDLNQTNTTNSLNPTNITDDSISENNDFNLTSYINDNFDNRNTMSVGDDDVTIIEIAAKKHYTDIYGGSELDAQKLISGHHPDYASVPYGKGTINEYYNNNFGKLSAEEQANAAKIIDEVTNNYDNASETSLNWYKSNDDIVSSYEVKQKALTILNEAKNQQSQISMTATKDHHIYIVTLDPDNGDILVNDPFNTAGKPDRYKTNDAFLNDYRDISFLNENKLK